MITCADEQTWHAALKWNRGALLQPKGTPQMLAVRDMISELDPWDVVLWLDGDDELVVGAVDRVRKAYENPDVWLTYGSFQDRDGKRDHDWDPNFGHRYWGMPPRSARWRASHLRTFRAGLFQAIPDAYLQGPAGAWLETCVDRAPMIAMLEMCGEHYHVFQDVLYVYNRDHERTRTETEITIEARDRAHVHAMTPLPELKGPTW